MGPPGGGGEVVAPSLTRKGQRFLRCKQSEPSGRAEWAILDSNQGPLPYQVGVGLWLFPVDRSVRRNAREYTRSSVEVCGPTRLVGCPPVALSSAWGFVAKVADSRSANLDAAQRVRHPAQSVFPTN